MFRIVQTLDFSGFAKKNKKISTHPLTVLTLGVIVHIEQKR